MNEFTDNTTDCNTHVGNFQNQSNKTEEESNARKFIHLNLEYFASDHRFTFQLFLQINKKIQHIK
jgi:hypothetical protein